MRSKGLAYLLEGEVPLTPEGGQPINFSVGNLNTFAEGMNCIWEVHKAFSKYYYLVFR